MIASAVSEIATNVLKYACSGHINICSTNNNRGINIECIDNGPGIESIDRAMVDGYSTDPTSLGVGLGAAKRAMDCFNIESEINVGTKIRMNKWLPIPEAEIEYGIISFPDKYYRYNGDAYILKEYNGNSVLVAIIDGLGEGEKAWRTSQIIKAVIYENYLRSLDDIIKICEVELKRKVPKSGAAIALLRYEPGKMHYCGVGDTFINVYSPEKITFRSQQGIVGTFKLPIIKTTTKRSLNSATIVMCTDGIKNHFTSKTLPVHNHAQIIADYIMGNFRRENGDATVIVIKLKKDNE